MSVTDDKFYRPRITQRVDFAPDLWMIRIDPGGEFKFVPGQYATLGVEGPQKRSERPYSIVSSPYENELEFFFELVPEGTSHLSSIGCSEATNYSCARVPRDDLRSTPGVAEPIIS